MGDEREERLGLGRGDGHASRAPSFHLRSEGGGEEGVREWREGGGEEWEWGWGMGRGKSVGIPLFHLFLSASQVSCHGDEWLA